MTARDDEVVIQHALHEENDNSSDSDNSVDNQSHHDPIPLQHDQQNIQSQVQPSTVLENLIKLMEKQVQAQLQVADTARQDRRLMQPAIFDGSSDVRQYLEDFDALVQHNRWNDNEATLQLRLALRGHAKDSASGDTYQELKESLLTRFEPTEEEARRELRHLTLRTGENIYTFGDHLQRMISLAYPNLDRAQQQEMAINELIEAIGDRTLGREFTLVRPQNFREALQRAHEFNQYMKGSRRSQIKTVSIEEPEEINKLKQTVSSLDKKLINLEDQIRNVEQVMHKQVQAIKTEVCEIQTDVKGMKGELHQTHGITSGINRKIDQLLGQRQRVNNRPAGNNRSFPNNVPTCNYCRKRGHVLKDCYSRKNDEAKTNRTHQENPQGSA